MIKAFVVVNNTGAPRLTKFYERVVRGQCGLPRLPAHAAAAAASRRCPPAPPPFSDSRSTSSRR